MKHAVLANGDISIHSNNLWISYIMRDNIQSIGMYSICGKSLKAEAQKIKKSSSCLLVISDTYVCVVISRVYLCITACTGTTWWYSGAN
jgi:hypothetical protein